ncbi:S16 family serine protease [Desulfovibrio aminophilus]|uniref:S16 family serine protease n=1 Tax=Desulfovibrio aminophilus TaxID=81425 RepID=UPI003397C9F0
MIFFRKNEEQRPEEVEGLEGLKAKAGKADLPEATRRAVDAELERLAKTDPSVAEYAIGSNYVDYLLSLPWNVLTQDNLDLKRAEAVLDGSHAGLGQVKDRVLEYLAQRTMIARRPASILVVDDEPIARSNLHHILSREGYQVEVAANGEEALEKVRRWEFDCIVTDLKMDRMDGMTLLTEARKVSPNTKIMIVTGYATVDTAVQAMKTGAVHYLSKPIELDELRSAVRDILKDAARHYGSRSPILCFTGPPGVGKTSVGMAVAEALGRKFCRLSLAELRDEAELRGHRRTYVGALPGRIIQAIRAVGVMNPVFMLDEMDKIAQDAKGDPASALLEILDPEQNGRFLDRYLDVPFDLSSVLFIATANGTARLAGPVLDRMEVVSFSGYSETEKLQIAERFLVPRQLREHGLTQPFPTFTTGALSLIIREHTNEAGVRGLDREIGRVCRKLARACLEQGKPGFEGDIGPELTASLLGPARFSHEAAAATPRVGAATGLVWSDAGGELISVEASRMPGSGQLLLTGSLGEVLKESAQIALSHIRGRAPELGVDSGFFSGQDIHIHIPAGAVSKDGPSAGLTIAVALISLLTGRAARSDVALSGEISLSGRVLRVAGVREKLLAAVRGGVRQVILPAENAADVELLRRSTPGLPEIILARDIGEALVSALEQGVSS